MPVFNGQRFLREALESICHQTFDDFEFIAVDDGSTDMTLEILESVRRRDTRLRIIRQPQHRGIVAALNQGMKACSGTYIARMDADDVALPDRLVRQVSWLDAHPHVTALGGAVSYIDETGREWGLIRPCTPRVSPLWANPLLHPTVMFRNAFVRDLHLRYCERYRYAEDYHLWLQICRFGTLDALDEVVLQYRLTREATRFRHLEDVLQATLRVKWNAWRRLGIKPRFIDILRYLGERGLSSLPSTWIARLYIALLSRQTRKADQ
ncbi:glycosyltransferase [Candidatus Ozemobacteraceae bacterium]|nr:glycosyltransferase [Candidatus Ozemobacteraceae bacterium]